MMEFRDCKIGFRNFSGKEGKYNKEGDRSFAIFFDEDRMDQAKKMLQEGWNIKIKEDRDGFEYAYLDVAVSYRHIPPTVMVINSRYKNILNEDQVGQLDWLGIKKVNAIINPSPWNINGNSGIKAYLYRLYVEIIEDSFESEYDDIPFIKEVND